MAATTTITAIRPTKSCKLITPEMFDTSATMTTSAKHPYLVYKIAFLHFVRLAQRYCSVPLVGYLKYPKQKLATCHPVRTASQQAVN